MAELPKPVRAYIGLWARAISEARELPRRAAELPVVVASTTARATLRAGQQYADLVTRGDGVLSRLQGTSEEPPAWATFDEDLPVERGRGDQLGGDQLGGDQLGRDQLGGDLSDLDLPGAPRRPGARKMSGPRGRKPSAFDAIDDEP